MRAPHVLIQSRKNVVQVTILYVTIQVLGGRKPNLRYCIIHRLFDSDWQGRADTQSPDMSDALASRTLTKCRWYHINTSVSQNENLVVD